MEDKICKIHGLTPFGSGKKSRCNKCSVIITDRVRKKHKEILVAEHGGKCQRCGYDRCIRALQFHHRDRGTKEFSLSGAARTFSLERKRTEALKCDLVCSNCHMEIEEERLVGSCVS